MTGIRARILGAITALLTGVGPAAAQQSTPFSDVQQDAIHALILDTIRENPEVIIDSIMAYQEQVIVEFFDYNCPYCRRAAPEVNALIDEDPDLRVVMREFPILGPDSETAARASLAARAQGKYAEFHDALMAQPRANAATIRRTANEVGLDFERLQA
ncbi:DsbA family protein, partial [Leisingera sp. F5]|uniref:DsbA family protein n=1 Tax=Leisingera sp. F5 TaxID=1813816 RepID=UPI0025BBCFB3